MIEGVPSWAMSMLVLRRGVHATVGSHMVMTLLEKKMSAMSSAGAGWTRTVEELSTSLSTPLRPVSDTMTAFSFNHILTQYFQICKIRK